MPAKSVKQKRFFQIVEGIKSGEIAASYSKKAADAARSMKAKAIKHFSRTKEAGLPVRSANAAEEPTIQSAAKSIIKHRRETNKRAKEIFGD